MTTLLNIPEEPAYYLGAGEFTKPGEISRAIANEIKGNFIEDIIRNIDGYVTSLPVKQNWRLWRNRTVKEILRGVQKGIPITGCTDAALIFVTLARIKGIPAAYVETVDKLQSPIRPIDGHVFVDYYESNIWKPYNPRHGPTVKTGRIYIFAPNQSNRKYVEIGRGLDFSQLYTIIKSSPVELRTVDRIRKLIMDYYDAQNSLS